MTGTVVDLFAGPGGWDIAARSLDLDPVGIEIDADACATRAAAGLTTIRADLATYWPTGLGQLDGLIASPPCPAFSQAGNRDAVADLPTLVGLCDADDLRWDQWLPAASIHLGQLTPDAGLLIEPLAWVDRWEPTWVALEQVPPVLPFWEAAARWLARRGYSAWAGVVCAADYGVPQTRHRAVLLAHRDRMVCAPTPSHAEHPQQRLFGDPERPWVSMAEGLGWDGVLATNVDQREDGTGSALKNWAWTRPATTVCGDHRIWPPGHRINSDDIDRLGADEAGRRYTDRAGRDAIRVTTEQRAALQSFPPDYPFRGTKTSIGRQIGNAVPPLLARRLLQQVTP